MLIIIKRKQNAGNCNDALTVQLAFLSHSHMLVNSLFAEPNVGGKTRKLAVEKHSVFNSLLSFNSLFLPSDHLESSIPFSPHLFLCLSFVAHTGKCDWFTAGPVTALWRFLPFLHFVAFAETVICHCACNANLQHYIDWSESEKERGYWPDYHIIDKVC